MKRVISIAWLIAILIAPVFSTEPVASIEWKETTVDFGKIPMGKPVTVEFSFKNPGMIPLVIKKVDSSCGCTVAEYPQQPIMSGVEAKIIVTYDAETEGYFSKTITIYSNAEGGLTKLYIQGTVIK